MMLGIFQCRDVLLMWIMEGQGPTCTVLSVGAGQVVLILFLLSIISLFLSVFL